MVQQVCGGSRGGLVELLLQPTVAQVNSQEAWHAVSGKGWISLEGSHEVSPLSFFVVARGADWPEPTLPGVSIIHPTSVRAVDQVSHGVLQGCG